MTAPFLYFFFPTITKSPMHAAYTGASSLIKRVSIVKIIIPFKLSFSIK